MPVSASTRSRASALAVGLIALLVLAIWVSLSVGSAHLPMLSVVRMFLGIEDDGAAMARRIVFGVRLPRVGMAALVGAVLAMSGASIQGLFKNPLAEPGLVGVSAGGSFGAAAAIVALAPLFAVAPVWARPFALPICAFLGSLATSRIVLRIGSSRGQTSVLVMILSGVAVNAFVGAAIGLATYFATDRELRDLVFWLLGSFSGATPLALLFGGIPMVLALVLLPRHGRALNLLALGDLDARRLGVSVDRTKRSIVVLVALGVGASVAVAGLIGFVGLIVPHLVRLMAGPDHRRLLPLSALLGASLLVVADTLARTLVSPMDLPIGVLTALLGAPLFLFLLVRGERFEA